MKKMIDELWDGEISPQDNLISDNQEYTTEQENKAEEENNQIDSKFLLLSIETLLVSGSIWITILFCFRA